MAKVSVIVAYAVSTLKSPGVYEDVPTKRNYYGEVLKNVRRWTGEQQVNESLLTSNRISIIADDFAHANWSFIKFVRYAGVFWEVSNVEIVERPRLILTLGSVYHGPTD